MQSEFEFGLFSHQMEQLPQRHWWTQKVSLISSYFLMHQTNFWNYAEILFTEDAIQFISGAVQKRELLDLYNWIHFWQHWIHISSFVFHCCYCFYICRQMLLNLLRLHHNYRQTCSVSRNLVGATPTTCSLSTCHLASMNCSKTAARCDEKHISFKIWCVLY